MKRSDINHMNKQSDKDSDDEAYKDALVENNLNLSLVDPVENDDFAYAADEDEVEKNTAKKQCLNTYEEVAKAFNPTQMYLTEIGSLHLLSAEEELQLTRAVAKGDKEARKRMIESNLRLVVKIARHYISCGMDFSDLIEEGNFGLILAVEKFDPEKGFRFSTYATWWIRQSIERAIMNQSRTVRIPIHILRELRSYQKKSLEMAKNLEHDPSIKELSTNMDKPVRKIQEILNLNQTTVSLDNTISKDNDGVTFADQLEDDSSADPYNFVQNEDIRKLVFNLLDNLDLQQKNVLIKRFGLHGDEGMSLEEVANNFNISREKARQLQNSALRRLHNVMVERGLQQELEDET